MDNKKIDFEDVEIVEEATEEAVPEIVETADATPIIKRKEIPFRVGDIGQNVKAYQKELGLPETGIWDKKCDETARG